MVEDLSGGQSSKGNDSNREQRKSLPKQSMSRQTSTGGRKSTQRRKHSRQRSKMS